MTAEEASVAAAMKATCRAVTMETYHVNVFCSTGDYALHVDVGNTFNIVVFVRDSVVVRGIVSL